MKILRLLLLFLFSVVHFSTAQKNESLFRLSAVVGINGEDNFIYQKNVKHGLAYGIDLYASLSKRKFLSIYLSHGQYHFFSDISNSFKYPYLSPEDGKALDYGRQSNTSVSLIYNYKILDRKRWEASIGTGFGLMRHQTSSFQVTYQTSPDRLSYQIQKFYPVDEYILLALRTEVNYQFAEHWIVGIMSHASVPAPNGLGFYQITPKITYIFD
ncbi:hypothetical protein [Thermoflexibacter ruber]|uniref:Outer membrane protein beta-barrel domain-containing protein n=1 Tax=Thermoflexibacter ruber TaxID=1003 RepID=A0A1I2ESF3_9BACT|nr:hypothetical protein [Thermoflexibacter ruber]SFE95653.1 hypothetical protein SAMN04488541_10115 [Thermoflexibacter ruber]